MNIFDTVEQAARDNPERAALINGPQVLSYRALVQYTAGIAQRLADAGVGPGDVVMVRTFHPTASWLLTLSLARLGAVSMGGPHAMPLGELIARCGVKALVLKGAPSPDDDLPEGLRVLDEGPLLEPVPVRSAVLQTRSVAPDAVWRIALSSGTTGIPKAIPWTHAAAHSTWQTLTEPLAPLGPSDRVLVFMDMINNYAINRSLRVLSTGATLVLPANPTPQEMVRCIEMYGVTQVVTVTSLAVQLTSYLDQKNAKPGLRFLSLKCMIVGGEAVSAVVQRILRTKVCSNLVITYGSSECGGIATADPALLYAHPRATGRLLPTTQAHAVDARGVALPSGQVGRLRFRTPGMGLGYLGEAALSAQSFADGWYQSRDMGFVDDKGIVTLGARSDEWLALGNESVDPQRLETVICDLPGITEAVVFLAPDPQGVPTLVALYAATESIDIALVRSHCAERLDARLVPQILGQVRELPRTSHGKISRRHLSENFKIAQVATDTGSPT